MANHQVQAVQLRVDSDSESCPGCGSRRFIRKPAATKGFCLSFCQKCGTACTFPKPKTEELETHYSAAYYGSENVKFISPMERCVEWMNRLRARRLHRVLQISGKVLDVGCGRGLVLQELSRLGHECYGIERSHLAASRAKRIPKLQIYTDPLENCGFISSTFDLALLWHVLEHLEEPGRILVQIREILKPGALLVLEVPNFSSWQARAFGKYWFHLDIPRHLYHFSQEGIVLLLKANGYTVDRISTFSLEQGPFGAIQSILNCLISPVDGLYGVLKKEFRTSGWKKLALIGLGSILSLPAAVFAVIEAAAGRGAVLRIMARKT